MKPRSWPWSMVLMLGGLGVWIALLVIVLVTKWTP